MQGRYNSKIESLFKQQYQNLCLLSFSYSLDMDKSEDIVQDVFVSLLQKDTINILNLEPYIKTCVRNASLNYLRDTKKFMPLADKEHMLKADETSKLEDSELQERIKIALEKLPQKCKKVFELCAIEGKEYNKTAELLDISVNTVKSHMKKAYKTLRFELRKTFFSLLMIATFSYL